MSRSSPPTMAIYRLTNNLLLLRARFGKPQFEIGTMWPGRGELSCDGVHAPLQAGIHGQSEVGAFSVVL